MTSEQICCPSYGPFHAQDGETDCCEDRMHLTNPILYNRNDQVSIKDSGYNDLLRERIMMGFTASYMYLSSFM